jgi:hypothetical protein
MTTTETSGRKSPNNNPMDGAVAILCISHVRLSIAQKATTKTVPIPWIMHKIMNKIRDNHFLDKSIGHGETI